MAGVELDVDKVKVSLLVERVLPEQPQQVSSRFINVTRFAATTPLGPVARRCGWPLPGAFFELAEQITHRLYRRAMPCSRKTSLRVSSCHS
jgi:hypothetical protein